MTQDRPRRERVPLTATVVRTETVGSLVRVVLGGLTTFTPSEFTDSYVKLVFPGDGDQPRLRTYTVRAWDGARHELTLDVVVHGDAGVAGPWARTATAGDEIQLLGPGGDYSPHPRPPGTCWSVTSALPAIAVALEALPAGIPAYVFLEVHGPEDEIPLPTSADATVRWIHRGADVPGAHVVGAVAALDFPSGRTHAFVHGEAGMVKELRRLLVLERKVPRDQLSISGYWRLGADDEGWRSIKRDWNREIETAEAAAIA